MDLGLAGNVVLVTGASRGLGAAMTVRLAREGAVVVAAARSKDALADVAAQGDGRISTAVVDMRDEESVAGLAGLVVERHGRVDGLINNAGIAPAGKFATQSPAIWQEALAVNVLAPMRLAQSVGEHMLRQGSGRIVNVASTTGVRGKPYLVAYSTTKGAVVRFTEALAAEWAGSGVQVNCIAPGAFVTDAQRSVLDSPELLAKRVAKIPARRMADPEEVVPLACLLVSPLSPFTTGASSLSTARSPGACEPMIIDAHAHVWPDPIASVALSANRLPDLVARGDGTVTGLMDEMAASGVSASCCLGIAHQARHVDRVNEFVSGLRSHRLIPVGTVHVDLSVEDNLASLERHGVRAVKIHPLFQNFALDDRRLWEIFEGLGSDVAVIAHVGAGGDARANALSTPAMVRQIVRQFSDLRLIACHFGGYKLLDDAEEMLSGADVVLETSWPPSLSTLQPDRVRRLIQKHGADRVVFGSDWPMTSPGDEIVAIDALGLSGTETKHVLGGTLARIPGVDSPWVT